MPRIPTWQDIMQTPAALKAGMNVWPPFVGMGVRVSHISKEWRHARVRLSGSRLNRNFVGTQYGGSIFAMTDAFWMILVAQSLGRDYHVWDQRAEVEFVKPGRSALTAEFHVTDELLDELRGAAAGGDKVLRWVETVVTDQSGDTVAVVRRQLYVRLRRELRPS